MRKTRALIAAVVSIGLPLAALAQSADGNLPRAAIEDAFTKSECSLPIDGCATSRLSISAAVKSSFC
jgi:hypothetical protein